MDFSIEGINNAIPVSGMNEYVKAVQEKVINIFGSADNIAFDNLMQNANFNKIYNKLNVTMKSKANTIFGLDGDSKNVSEKELRTFLH